MNRLPHSERVNASLRLFCFIFSDPRTGSAVIQRFNEQQRIFAWDNSRCAKKNRQHKQQIKKTGGGKEEIQIYDERFSRGACFTPEP